MKRKGMKENKLKLSRTGIGYGIGIISTMIWSSANVFISYISRTQELSPTILALWRNLILVLVLGIVFMAGFRRLFHLGQIHIPLFLLYGFVIATDNVIGTISVQFNGASVATVLLYGSVAFSAIFGKLLFHEKMDRLKNIAIVVCIIGCIVVSDAMNREAWHLNPLGIAAGLLSGLTFSIYSIIGKETSQRGINSWTAMLYSYGFSMIFLVGYSLILMALNVTPPPDGIGCISLFPNLNRSGWLAMLGLAVFPTLIGSGLYVVEMGFIPVNTANLIGTLEPFLTGLQAYFLLGERLQRYQIIGGLIIISAMIFSRRSDES